MEGGLAGGAGEEWWDVGGVGGRGGGPGSYTFSKL